MLDIEWLIEVSKEVINDGCLENGAIVAANATKYYFPAQAKHYFYVWPRDASFVCLAADMVNISGIQERFFAWCLDRAEGFDQTGLLYEKYYVNGPKALCRFQPDQTATVLVAIWHHYNMDLTKAERFENLIIKAADGLCNMWKNDHFDIITNDLWEERLTFPDLNENFTYSLASCIRGLECANEMISNPKWLLTANQMRMRLNDHFVAGSFVRSYGKLIDERIDASMLGLVYPFGIYKAEDEHMISTVQEMEKKIVIHGGVHRYELDQYDGWVYEKMPRNKGAGAWPLLNFWMSIYYLLKGDRNKAEKYYNWVLNNLSSEDGYMPEQIFDNSLQISVSPLLWSHAMFIIASKFLNYV